MERNMVGDIYKVVNRYYETFVFYVTFGYIMIHTYVSSNLEYLLQMENYRRK